MSEREHPDDAYERGHLDGEIAARLAGYDRHFEAINGSLAKIAEDDSVAKLAEVVSGLALAVQRLGDQAIARDATVITTAAALKDTVISTANALKDAEQARRDKSDQRWSPLARSIAVIGVIATVVGVAVAVFLRVQAAH